MPHEPQTPLAAEAGRAGRHSVQLMESVQTMAGMLRERHPGMAVLVIQGGASEEPDFLAHFGVEAYEAGRKLAPEFPNTILAHGGCRGAIGQFSRGWMEGRTSDKQKAYGIWPKQLDSYEPPTPHVDELLRVDTFLERRQLFWTLARSKDEEVARGCILFMAGGFGTLDELSEVQVYAQTGNGAFDFPRALTPTQYWEPLQQLYANMARWRAVRPERGDLELFEFHEGILEGARSILAQVHPGLRVAANG